MLATYPRVFFQLPASFAAVTRYDSGVIAFGMARNGAAPARG